jgi:hypothetical protein
MAEVLLVCTGLMVLGALLVGLFMPSRASSADVRDEQAVSPGTVAV